MSKPKIYVFDNTKNGACHYVAISEDGVQLASHICSWGSYFRNLDMGFTSTSKHSEYDAHYPNGWELEWVPDEEVETHQGLQKALLRGGFERIVA